MHRDVPPRHRSFARAMRTDSTLSENLLWQAVRNRQVEGVKFKRQVPVDGYILDFVSFDRRLIIEVDGSQHAGSASDKIRDGHFHAQGFRILRFWNEDVEKNLDGVVMMIRDTILSGGE